MLTRIRKGIYYHPHFVDKRTEVWEMKLSHKTHMCKEQSGTLIPVLGTSILLFTAFMLPENIDDVLCAKCCAKGWEGKASELEGLYERRGWVQHYREAWERGTHADTDIPLTQLRFQVRGSLRQEPEWFRRSQLEWLQDEERPGKISVKTGRVKQLEAFGEITNRMTGAKGPRGVLEKAWQLEPSRWASLRGWESPCCSSKGAAGGLWAVPTSHLGRSVGVFDFSLGYSDSPCRTSLSFLDRSIVISQCSISFYCRAKWISYTHISAIYMCVYIPSFLDFLPI